MDSILDFDGPVALEFRVKHHEDRSKAQAARIVELEAKVAYLEKCLREVSAKTVDAASISSAGSSVSTTCKFAETSPNKSESASLDFKTITSTASIGSAEDPVLVEDSDSDDLPAPLHSSPQPSKPFLVCSQSAPHSSWYDTTLQLQRTPSPHEQKPVKTDGSPTFELHPRPWGMVDSPRKKPKLTVEVVIPSYTKPPPHSRAPKLPRRSTDPQTSSHNVGNDLSLGSATYADARPLTPLSPLSPLSPSPPIPPVCDHLAALSPNVEDGSTLGPARAPATHADARARSRELSYLDDPPERQALPTLQTPATYSAPQTPPARVESPTGAMLTRLGSSPRNQPSIQDRLIGIPSFAVPTLSMSLQKLRVSRTDMHEGRWKLAEQKMCVRDVSGRNFIFPTHAQNPCLPSEPGRPGLLFRANDKYGWKSGTQTVFVRLSDSKRFRYVGEYCLELDGQMSHQEYQSLEAKARRAWAGAILDAAKFREIRTRVLLNHELGRRPIAQEVTKAVKAKQFDTKLMGDEKSRAMDEIVDAYERGEEHMSIWRMKCVGFDQNLLQQIAELMNGKAQA